MALKICKRCKQEKDISCFYPHKTTKDRLQTWCTSCKNEVRREQRRNKIGFYATERIRYHDSHLLTCRKLYHRNKWLAIKHYSAGTLKCSKCGYDDTRALSLDHINGDGTTHRKKLNGVNLCKWLVKKGYPEGYQVLCMNCQFIKRYEECGYSDPTINL